MAAVNWRERAQTLTLSRQAFIAGRFTDAESGRVFDVTNPSDGQRLAQDPSPPFCLCSQSPRQVADQVMSHPDPVTWQTTRCKSGENAADPHSSSRAI